MKVCLVNPPLTFSVSHISQPAPFYPMGLLYIASVLEAEHQVSIIDALVEDWQNVHKITVNSESRWYGGLEFEQIVQKIKENNIKLVGITVPFSISYWSAQKVASAIKNIDKNIITILGGPHVTVRPQEVLSNKDVDFIVIGEGENAMFELINALENENFAKLALIEGIGFKKNGQQIINFSRKPIQDLDALPFPARHLLSLENYFSAVEAGKSYRSQYILPGKKWATLITSRGCPYGCVFCAINLTMGKKWRPRSAENVVEEIEELVYKYSIGHLTIEDDNMTLDMSRAKRICDLIIQKKLAITWSMPNGVRADALDEELIEKMRAAGCMEVFVAPESGDQDVVDNIIKKKMDLKKVEEAVRLFNKYGVVVNVNFVIGCIGETKENIKQSINFSRKLLQLGANGIAANIAVPYYGTELYTQAKEKGFLLDMLNDEHLSSARPLISTPEFKPKELLDYKNQFYMINPWSKVIKISFSKPKLLIKAMFSLRTWHFLAGEARRKFLQSLKKNKKKPKSISLNSINNNFIEKFKEFYKKNTCIACDKTIANNMRFFSEVWSEDLSTKFSVFECSNCGLAYVYPFLSIEEENKLYEDYLAHHTHENIINNAVKLRFKCQELIDDLIGKVFLKSKSSTLKKILSCFLFQRVLVAYPLFSHSINGPLRILDVGCGDGHFLSKAKRFNCICYGIEYHDNLIKRLNASGITAADDLQYFIDKISNDGDADKFDIIRINWVLEHVINPGSILEGTHRLLKDKGELIIGVPNFNTFAKIFKENFQMHLPQHRQIFTIKSIIRIIERHGFAVIYYKTKSLGAISSSFIRKFRFKKAGLPLRLVDLAISILLDLFNFGDAIEIYAKKKK